MMITKTEHIAPQPVTHVYSAGCLVGSVKPFRLWALPFAANAKRFAQMLSTPDYIPPKDARLLGRVFEQLFKEYQIPSDSDEAYAFAARLIVVYQSGVRDAKLLKTLTVPFGRQSEAV
ncbi:hypothetical protein [Sinorhizobium americanum]